MLGKVMKYEWRACGRLLWPMFGLALAMSVLLRLAFFVAPRIWEPLGYILGTVAGLAAVLMLVAVVLLTLVYTVVRFYQSTMAGEAYLSFTLPVSPSAHLCGRLVVHSLFGIVSGLVSIVSVFILVPGLFRVVFFEGASIPVHVGGMGTIEVPINGLPPSLAWSLIGFIVFCVVLSTVFNILRIYASLAIGTRISRNRILGGIVGYLLLYIVQSVAAVPLVLLFIPLFTERNMAFTQRVLDIQIADISGVYAMFELMMNMMWFFVLIGIAISLLFAVAHFFISHYIFAKKLNVE